MLVLGLDISTNIIGGAIIDHNEDLLECFYIDLHKTKDVLDKSIIIKDRLMSIFQKYKIDNIYIEEPLKATIPGMSNIDIIIKLSGINHIAMFICFILTKLHPEHIHFNTARSLAWGNISQKLTRFDKKLFVCNKVLDKWPEFSKYVQEKKKKDGSVEIRETPTFDMSDACTIALSGLRRFKSINYNKIDV